MLRHKFPPGKVYASPTCRTQQMAEIMFPDNNTTYSGLLLYDRILSLKQITEKRKFITTLLSAPVKKSTNRYILGHQGTYGPIGYDLPEGHSLFTNPLVIIRLISWE